MATAQDRVQYEDRLSRLAGAPRKAERAPEPAPRPRSRVIVSVDDHLLEPPDLFVGRLPAKFAEATPTVVERPDGTDAWQFLGDQIPVMGANALASWTPETRYLGPVAYRDVRPGAWQVEHRLLDMDIDGVERSLCFPSTVFGFAGQRLHAPGDVELTVALVRAYNDWMAEVWAGRSGGRLIANQLVPLNHPDRCADEIYRNAARGFRSVTFTENPAKLGQPPIADPVWEPFLRACDETHTIVNLHVGSSSETILPHPLTPPEAAAALFPLNCFSAAVDWLFANVPVRFPGLRVVLSEGGIGWVPMLYDRLAYGESRYHETGLGKLWKGGSMSPGDGLRHTFRFALLFDPAAMRLVDVIGSENIMAETDYPHSDATWPDSQANLDNQLRALPKDAADAISWRNATELYRLEAPAVA